MYNPQLIDFHSTNKDCGDHGNKFEPDTYVSVSIETSLRFIFYLAEFVSILFNGVVVGLDCVVVRCENHVMSPLCPCVLNTIKRYAYPFLEGTPH